MHNLKDLRKNLETFKKKFQDRNLDFNTDEFNRVDKINRELLERAAHTCPVSKSLNDELNEIVQFIYPN